MPIQQGFVTRPIKRPRNARSNSCFAIPPDACTRKAIYWLNFKAVGDVVKETFVPEDSVAPVAATGLRGFLAKFTVLKGAQRELWLTFAIKLLIISAYSITNKTLILWLSSDLGFNDQSAGALVGRVWTAAMTLVTLFARTVTSTPRPRP